MASFAGKTAPLETPFEVNFTTPEWKFRLDACGRGRTTTHTSKNGFLEGVLRRALQKVLRRALGTRLAVRLRGKQSVL